MVTLHHNNGGQRWTWLCKIIRSGLQCNPTELLVIELPRLACLGDLPIGYVSMTGPVGPKSLAFPASPSAPFPTGIPRKEPTDSIHEERDGFLLRSRLPHHGDISRRPLSDLDSPVQRLVGLVDAYEVSPPVCYASIGVCKSVSVNIRFDGNAENRMRPSRYA